MSPDKSPSSDGPPRKRARVLACRRCRHRKQRCEDERPCANCHKAGEECIPTDPAPRALADGSYVRALEERVAELEALDPENAADHLSSAPGRRACRNEGEWTSPAFDAQARVRLVETGSTTLDHVSPPSQEVPHAATRAPSPPSSDSRLSKASRPVEVVDNLSQPSAASALWLDEQLDSATALLTHESITSPAGSVGRAGTQENARLIPVEVEEQLLEAYRERVQSQYPFLHWPTFLTWYNEWKHHATLGESAAGWKSYFVKLVFATASLLASGALNGSIDSRLLYRDGVALLRPVLEQPDPVLHAQAYLMLCMHALHWSSTQRLISLISSTVRYCVQRHLHLAECEPRPANPETRLQIQVRRRCFWSAWGLDRMMSAAFDLPPCLPDAMITTRLFANINDGDLLAVASRTAMDEELPDAPKFTAVSSALHILQCRRIQSEVCQHTLRADYSAQYEHASEWRKRITEELETYKSRVHTFSEPESNSHTSYRWLAMIYHYTMLMLHRPTQSSVLGPAGDRSVQASSQACLTFRRFQKDRTIAQTWLALLHQFQAGITLLYVFWATPPELRTENYDSPDVPDALRACSNILAILSDRWLKADCLRDVFELLAREIPLVDRPNRPHWRISQAVAADVQAKLPEVTILIVHRPTLRMIEEMISQDFPRLANTNHAQLHAPLPRCDDGAAADFTSGDTPWSNITFDMPFLADQFYGTDETINRVSDMNSSNVPVFSDIF